MLMVQLVVIMMLVIILFMIIMLDARKQSMTVSEPFFSRVGQLMLNTSVSSFIKGIQTVCSLILRQTQTD